MHGKDLKARFEREGFIGPVTLLGRSEMNAFSESLAGFITEGKQAQEWYSSVACSDADNQVPVETLYDSHWQLDAVRKLCTRQGLISLLENLMGTELSIWRTTFWIKEPGARRVEWHQDTYKEERLGSFPNINAWVALDDAPEDNCLRFCNGTHKSIIDLSVFKDEDYVSYLKGSELLPPPPLGREVAITEVPLTAGQCVIFDGRTLHGSPPNKTTVRRAGIVIRFIPTGYELNGFSGKVMPIN